MLDIHGIMQNGFTKSSVPALILKDEWQAVQGLETHKHK